MADAEDEEEGDALGLLLAEDEKLACPDALLLMEGVADGVPNGSVGDADALDENEGMLDPLEEADGDIEDEPDTVADIDKEDEGDAVEECVGGSVAVADPLAVEVAIGAQDAFHAQL